MEQKALLALEDGSLFYGKSIGVKNGFSVGEIVFNTSISGYQEILTDPSYHQQIVTLTYPHIGNVGINLEDMESSTVHASGLVIKELSLVASNWRSNCSLSDYLVNNNIIAISGIDTRKLTRHLRQNGVMKACLLSGDKLDWQMAIDKARKFPGLIGMDLTSVVTTKDSYIWNEGVYCLNKDDKASIKDSLYNVIVYDYGVKHNILRILVDLGCKVKVVPASTPASEVLEQKPDGVFLSNGPGDPSACGYAINIINDIMLENIPMFGICLGYQLLSIALGTNTLKMKFGHHGANHPVQCLKTKKVYITSQNHGFAVDEASLPDVLYATHKSLFDDTLQGVHHIKKPVFGFQGHPEASPGPHDLKPLFEHFIELMQIYKKNNRDYHA